MRFRLRAGPPVEASQLVEGRPLPRFASQTSEGLKVFTSHLGLRAAAWGDWVVIDEHAHVQVIGNFMFRHLYEPIP